MPNDVNCKHYDPINGWCEKLSNFGYPKHFEYCPKSPCEYAEPIEQPMSDNDIIKALGCCRNGSDCDGCRYGYLRTKSGLCVDTMHSDARALINRLKSEIETLKSENTKLKHEMSYMKSPNTIGDTHEMGAW